MHDAIPSRILNGWLRLEEDLTINLAIRQMAPVCGASAPAGADRWCASRH